MHPGRNVFVLNSLSTGPELLLAAEKIEELKSEAALAEKMFDETEEKVKFLEGQIRVMETRLKQQRGEFAMREKELLDMLESK